MTEQTLAGVPLYSQATYVHALRARLPAAAFQPARSRALLVPVYAAIATLAIIAVGRGWVPWFVMPVASLVIGATFTFLTFLAHEAMHGGIVRGKSRFLIGWIGFLPFTLSPYLWSIWHDRIHHSTANLAGDPDAYPTLEKYRGSRAIRIVTDAFSLGGRRWRGGLSLILGFTVQSAAQLIGARGHGLTKAQHRRAIGETLAGVAVWATVAWLVGFVPFLFIYVIPLVVANVIVMGFILTNHSLSPRIEINDPLVGGLSVTTNRVVDWLTLRFGFHVEHHLFPAMSSRHAVTVREHVRALWPERYQSMSLREALGRLHRTARVYKDATTLVDPRTGAEFATLMPRAA